MDLEYSPGYERGVSFFCEIETTKPMVFEGTGTHDVAVAEHNRQEQNTDPFASPPQAPIPEGDGACGGASAFTTIARESRELGRGESSLIGTTHTA